MNRFQFVGKLNKILAACFLLSCTLLFVYFHQNITNSPVSVPVSTSSEVKSETENLNVRFLSTGQSECILITTNSKTLLIDAGDAADYDVIAGALNSLNITKIDIFIATHPHSDHIGSAKWVLENYKVKRLIVPNIPKEYMPEYSLYESMISAAENNGTEIVKSKVGTRYKLGEDIYLKVLGPMGDYGTDLNNWSVVLRLTYGKTSFLFMGDCETPTEEDLLGSGYELKSTVLKVGHHGSKTSTSKEFLNNVNPKYAVILCGENNDYGHPNTETTQKLLDAKVKTYRTDINGGIIFTSDGKNIKVKTEQ